MTAEDYLITHFQAKKMDDNGLYYSKEDVMNAMKEYGKKCYIQGSNDCHKAMIDNLPDEDEIVNQGREYEYNLTNKIRNKETFAAMFTLPHNDFINGAMWVINRIKGE